MLFKKEDLQELVYHNPHKGFTRIQDDITSTSRWHINYELIFKYQDKFYATYYRRGATEQQDEAPYEYDKDEIECLEVYPVEKIVIEYVTEKPVTK